MKDYPQIGQTVSGQFKHLNSRYKLQLPTEKELRGFITKDIQALEGKTRQDRLVPRLATGQK